jgi:acetolactate decarboxylase
MKHGRSEMRATRLLLVFIVLVVSAAYAASCGSTAGKSASSDDVYQVSTLGALSGGVMAGDSTCGILTDNGDFGVGTFNGLDGEMVVLDGTVYQVPVSGVPRAVRPGMKTPFAEVKFFKAEKNATAEDLASLDALKSYVDGVLPSRNFVFAVRLDGTFDHVKARSVPRQSPPYPTLEEVVAEQTVFELDDVKGTMVGFFYPDYLSGVNQAGYHFHFLTGDRKAGGHVLDCSVDNAMMKLDQAAGLELQFPGGKDFEGAAIPAQP